MRCKSCLQDLSESAFYACNKSRCRECVKAAARAHRLANLEEVRAYDRARASLPHRIAKTKAISERWKTHYPNRRKAQVALGNAVRDGRIKPWPACEVPGCDAKPEAHHPDYSRPLLVVWLCPPHHKQAHAMTKEAA